MGRASGGGDEHVIKLHVGAPLRPQSWRTVLTNYAVQIGFDAVLADAASRHHAVLTDIADFLHLHLHRLHSLGHPLPTPDHNYLHKIVGLVSAKKGPSGSLKIRRTLTAAQLGQSDYRDLMETRKTLWRKPRALWASQDHLNKCISNYGLKKLETALKNNVWMHFHSRFRRFVELRAREAERDSKSGARIVLLCPETASRWRRRREVELLARDVVLAAPVLQDDGSSSMEEAKAVLPTGVDTDPDDDCEKEEASSSDAANRRARADFVRGMRWCLPARPRAPSKSALLEYDLKARWAAYLPLMIEMNLAFGVAGVKQFAVVPLKRGTVPGHMTFSTETLIGLERAAVIRARGGDSKGLPLREDYKNKASWDRLFNYRMLENKSSRFKHVVDTDGYSFCLHMTRRLVSEEHGADAKTALGGALDGDPTPDTRGGAGGLKRSRDPSDDEESERKSAKAPRTAEGRGVLASDENVASHTLARGLVDGPATEWSPALRQRLMAAHRSQLLVGVDPGRHELLSMATLECTVSDATGRRRAERKLRYTRLQRRNETGAPHQAQRRRQLDASLWSKKTDDKRVVDEPLKQRVREAQEALSGTCGRASDLVRFGEYLEAKWLCLKLCGAHLSRKLEYRALRYKAWAGRRRSENRLVRSIRAKFGRGAVLAIGDWSKVCRTSGFRGLAPTPGVGLRRRLARDFLVVGTPEAYTSQRCSECGSEVRPVAERCKVPTSKKRRAAATGVDQEKEDEKSKDADVRGLRQCVSTQCGIRWNRDLNSARGIVRNAVELARSGRPLYGRGCASTRPTCGAPLRRPRASVIGTGGTGTTAVPVSGLAFPVSGFRVAENPGGAGPAPPPCCVTI